MAEPKLTYAVRGPAPGKANAFIVWEYDGASPVNEYTGYDNGTFLRLYPRRKLIPSTVELKKLSVNIRETRREF